MGGRPWGPIKTDDPAVRDLVRWLRGLVDASGLKVRGVAERCGLGLTATSDRLSGAKAPSQQFVDDVIEACAPRPEWSARKRQARELMARPRTPAPRVPVVIDAYSRVLDSQRETIDAQRQLIGVSDELSQARRQLLESTRLELRAGHMISVLRIVLLQLAGVVSELAGERALARASLDRARAERDRATALADAALALITSLGDRVGGVEVPVEVPLITSDDVLLDLGAGLRRVQRILDDQDDALDRLESDESPAVMAERLIAPYLDAPMPAAVLDEDGRFLQMNHWLPNELFCDEDELLQKKFSDIACKWGSPDSYWLLMPTGLGWFNVRLWTVRKCQIVVMENAAGGLSDLISEESMLPSVAWIDEWMGHVDDRSVTRLSLCRVRFRTDPDVNFGEQMFPFLCGGGGLVDLGPDDYLLISRAPEADPATFIEEMTSAVAAASNDTPFAVDGAEYLWRMGSTSADVMWDVETSTLWTRSHGGAGPWVVREPIFSDHAGSNAGPEELRYRPIRVPGNESLWGVEVVGPVTPERFAAALDQLDVLLRTDQFGVVTFPVTSAELRSHDWSCDFPWESDAQRRVRLMLVDDLTFEDYQLLRRFARRGRAGLAREDAAVQAAQLRLEAYDQFLDVGDAIDLYEIRRW